ncbi:hypothetical protein Hamer_G001279 [Homarus americanus]|uniref:Uncharacterized protein n=1 Tax=Homarus americanus TaxID=6706 RepID=A0A8J5TM63_HOMAM|nr:hypothetical protein Hamer_G001279 [Homarus americanus]
MPTYLAVDNIDHDPSTASSHSSFHGTGISLFQHPDGHGGTDQIVPQLDRSVRKISKEPEEYAVVSAVVAIKNPPIPEQPRLT